MILQSSHQTLHFQSYSQTILHTFPGIKQIILTFSESYWQRILQTFPDFISLSNNTDIFRELLANNIA